MNIIETFRNKISVLMNDDEQKVSEKLIELATFFYKIDRRVSLAEQNYIDQLVENSVWKSSISAESFHRDCIARINRIVVQREEQISVYLSDLMQEISDLGAASKAKALVREVADADGEIADDEIKYLDIVSCYE